MKLYVFQTMINGQLVYKGAYSPNLEHGMDTVSVEEMAKSMGISLLSLAWWCARNNIHPFTKGEYEINEKNWLK